MCWTHSTNTQLQAALWTSAEPEPAAGSDGSSNTAAAVFRRSPSSSSALNLRDLQPPWQPNIRHIVFSLITQWGKHSTSRLSVFFSSLTPTLQRRFLLPTALHLPRSLCEKVQISEIFNTHYNGKKEKVHLFQRVSEPKTNEKIPWLWRQKPRRIFVERIKEPALLSALI